jgi:formylglycine-generating enzyme required for sulfatase activity
LTRSVFIGYRREDTADVSGRVYDRLRTAFGEEAIFKDVDTLDPGIAFGEYILTILPKCRVFLAMIGPQWIDIRNETGLRRLEDPQDWVRIELEKALTTPGLQVVPVLVNGAAMPRPDQLPASLERLPALNAAWVRRDPDFHRDMDKLIKALESGVRTGRVEVETLPRVITSGSAAAWQLIETSCDVGDYIEFQAHFPGTPEVLLAGRHRRRLEQWASVDRSDPEAIATFLRDASFSALDARAREAMHRAVEAQQQAEQQAVILRREQPKRAAEAARAGRPLGERSFPIELPGRPDWPTPKMIAIPPGRFQMGSPQGEERYEGYDGREEPQHWVLINHAFALGQHAVTVAEFAAFVSDTGYSTGTRAWIWTGEWKEKDGVSWNSPGFEQSPQDPVVCVSWHDAQAFLAWINLKLGLTDKNHAYRLPSEAEWEYACRAGTTTPFSFGDTVTTAQANYDGNFTYGDRALKGIYRARTVPVGSLPANAFGLHEMHGNAWEWCEDTYQDNYQGAPGDGSAWIKPDSSYRVNRGGSWSYGPSVLRSAYRYGNTPSLRGSNLGFRLARTL